MRCVQKTNLYLLFRIIGRDYAFLPSPYVDEDAVANCGRPMVAPSVWCTQSRLPCVKGAPRSGEGLSLHSRIVGRS